MNDSEDASWKQEEMLKRAVADGVRDALKRTDTQEAIARAVNRALHEFVGESFWPFLLFLVVWGCAGVTVGWVIYHYGLGNILKKILAFFVALLSLLFSKLT